jgi:uncharacterized protein YndB with AHSA1/START domain
MKISHVIEINSSLKDVFYWLEDPNRAKQWMTSVTKTKIIKETPNKVGTTFTETIEENGRELEMRGEIIDFIPGKKIAFHLESNIHNVKVNFTLQEIEDGTILTQNANIHFKGLLKIMIIVFGYFFKKKILKQIKSEFEKLKKLCEGDNTK